MVASSLRVRVFARHLFSICRATWQRLPSRAGQCYTTPRRSPEDLISAPSALLSPALGRLRPPLPTSFLRPRGDAARRHPHRRPLSPDRLRRWGSFLLAIFHQRLSATRCLYCVQHPDAMPENDVLPPLSPRGVAARFIHRDGRFVADRA